MAGSPEPPKRKQVAHFIHRLLDEIHEIDGKKTLRPGAVSKLIEETPDLAAAAVAVLLQVSQPGYRQLALTVATIYEDLTGDDSLARTARRALEEAGQAPPTVGTVTDGKLTSTDESTKEKKQGILLQVDRETLESGDIYNFLRLFKAENQDSEGLARLRQLRGRCLLAFALDEDPRPVWQIPEARAIVQKLFDALPYFPYFLDLRPQMGSFMLFFGCLADPKEAFEAAEPDVRLGDLNESWRSLEHYLDDLQDLRRRQGLPEYPPTTAVYINTLHPSVAEPVARSAVAISGLCRVLGEDARPVLSDLLTPYPEPMREDILATIESASD